MPKGTKVVDWMKPENDQKLFLAIIKTSEISNKYQAIANAFGKFRITPISYLVLVMEVD